MKRLHELHVSIYLITLISRIIILKFANRRKYFRWKKGDFSNSSTRGIDRYFVWFILWYIVKLPGDAVSNKGDSRVLRFFIENFASSLPQTVVYFYFFSKV